MSSLGFDNNDRQQRKPRHPAGPILRNPRIVAVLDQVDKKKLKIADAIEQLEALFDSELVTKDDCDYLVEKRSGAIKNWGQEALDVLDDRAADAGDDDDDDD